jgi:hypothetical protein
MLFRRNSLQNLFDIEIHFHQFPAKNVFEFVVPYAATLNVQNPAKAILSTGPISYPLNRPICGEEVFYDGRFE